MKTDDGIIYVLLEHFAHRLYPRAMEMERKLQAGGRLSDAEIDHVAQVIEDAKLLRPLIERHPEHQQGTWPDLGEKMLLASVALMMIAAVIGRYARPVSIGEKPLVSCR